MKCEACDRVTVTKQYAYVSAYRWHPVRMCARCAREDSCVGPLLENPDKPTTTERIHIEIAMRLLADFGVCES